MTIVACPAASLGSRATMSDEEKTEAKLGPDSVRHHEDGTIEVGGEEVDDPDEFKGDPIPGGPTDPDAPDVPGEEKQKD
jgi:hypothetical protein